MIKPIDEMQDTGLGRFLMENKERHGYLEFSQDNKLHEEVQQKIRQFENVKESRLC